LFLEREVGSGVLREIQQRRQRFAGFLFIATRGIIQSESVTGFQPPLLRFPAERRLGYKPSIFILSGNGLVGLHGLLISVGQSLARQTRAIFFVRSNVAPHV